MPQQVLTYIVQKSYRIIKQRKSYFYYLSARKASHILILFIRILYIAFFIARRK